MSYALSIALAAVALLAAFPHAAMARQTTELAAPKLAKGNTIEQLMATNTIIGGAKSSTDETLSFHVAEMRRPRMVIQFANDPPDIKHERAEVAAAVKKSGVPNDCPAFEDEGHGFQ